MGFSDAQMQSLAIITKCTGLLSIFGSAAIVYEVLSNPTKRKKVYFRLLLGMSISDLLSSTTIVVGNWAIPAGTEGVFDPRGNETTCRIQGFFIQLGTVTPLYNACLSTYYLLIICYGWKEQKVRKVEPYFHLVALLWGLGTSITGAVWDQYHNSNLWCWISTTKESNVLRWAFYYGPVWSVLFFITAAMIKIYRYVKKKEQNVQKYDFQLQQLQQKLQQDQQNEQEQHEARLPTNTTRPKRISFTCTASGKVACNTVRRNKQSRRVAIQSAWYVLAFYAAFIFATITRLIQTINGKTYYPIILLFAIFFPMQGFLNFLVYIRPKVIKYRERNPNTTILSGLSFGYHKSSVSTAFEYPRSNKFSIINGGGGTRKSVTDSDASNHKPATTATNNVNLHNVIKETISKSITNLKDELLLNEPDDRFMTSGSKPNCSSSFDDEHSDEIGIDSAPQLPAPFHCATQDEVEDTYFI